MAESMTDPFAAQLSHTLSATDFPSLGVKYEGKVRDTYRRGEELIIITTDRLSAFDRVLTTLPFKGDLLNQLSAFWFRTTAHIVRNHVVEVPDPAVTIARVATALPVEFVVRAYLSGSLWRDYTAGNDPYELALPKGMKQNQRLPGAPLLTPSTKASKGEHDEPISARALIERGLVSQSLYAKAEEVAKALFLAGQEHLLKQGLILADTKYELGLIDGELAVIDEMHTPDSSRFWVADEYQERFSQEKPQKMLDKENLRSWLMRERSFSGHGPSPTIPDEVRVQLAKTYAESYTRITGTAFKPQPGSTLERLRRNLATHGLRS